MKLSFPRLLFAAAALFAATAITAQDQVDVGLYHNGDKLEVRVRPSPSFNGIFSSMVFTIRWDGASGASLGAIHQEGAPAQYLPISRSGALRVNGSQNYQVYAGFGITPLAALETAWVAGEEYVIATIPVSGKGEFELLNDAWTAEAANNADYQSTVTSFPAVASSPSPTTKSSTINSSIGRLWWLARKPRFLYFTSSPPFFYRILRNVLSNELSK